MFPRLSPDVAILDKNGRPTKPEWEVAAKNKKKRQNDAEVSEAPKKKKKANLNTAFSKPTSSKLSKSTPSTSAGCSKKTLKPLAPKPAPEQAPEQSTAPPAVPIENEGPDVELFQLLEQVIH